MDGQTLLILIIVGSLLLIGTLIALGLLVKRTLNATVMGFSWFRKIWFEHFVWVHEDSPNGYPEGSINQQSHMESHQVYEQVGTHTVTNMVNGQSTTTTEPRFEYVTHWRTRYTYDIQRWQSSRDLQARGQDRSNVYWPPYTLDASTQERIQKQKEHYLIIFQTPRGKQYKRKLPQAAWTNFDDQAPYTLKVNLFGQVKRVEFHEEEQQIEIEERM